LIILKIMRKLSKYKTLKIFPRGVSLKKISSRVLNFRRPGWNFLQKKFPRRSKFSKKFGRYFGFFSKRQTVNFSSKKSILLLWRRLVGSVNLNDPVGLFFYNKSNFFSLFFKYISNSKPISLSIRPGKFILSFGTFKKSVVKRKSKVNKKRSRKKMVVVNPFLVTKPLKFLGRRKRYYKNSLETKTTLLNRYGNFISFYKLRRNDCRLKRHNILNYLIKPYYQINILLANLHFFSTPFQASQEIFNKNVLVNGKNIQFNISLKKGDVITFSRKSSFRYFKCFLQSYSFDNSLFSFVEVDYETETVIVIKNLSELSLEDFHLLIKDFFNLKNLTYL
jgi:ribosomal protein S4